MRTYLKRCDCRSCFTHRERSNKRIARTERDLITAAEAVARFGPLDGNLGRLKQAAIAHAEAEADASVASIIH